MTFDSRAAFHSRENYAENNPAGLAGPGSTRRAARAARGALEPELAEAPGEGPEGHPVILPSNVSEES
jgi:hypothetical protein